MRDDTVEHAADKPGEQVHGKPRASRSDSQRYQPGTRMVDGSRFWLADEVRYIQRWAAEHDGSTVVVGQLLLFATTTGNA